MKKFKVKYETRDYYIRTVEAENIFEAEQIVCRESWKRHRTDIYHIHEVTEVDNEEGKAEKDKELACCCCEAESCRPDEG
jgi:hypothetical protein